jgi:hypothetical protein
MPLCQQRLWRWIWWRGIRESENSSQWKAMESSVIVCY